MRLSSGNSHKAIFLDRDGVIIRKAPEGEYISRSEDVEVIPGALEAIAEFYRAGFKIIIATNQRGIALGKIGARELEGIHHRLCLQLAEWNVNVTGIYFCPHDESEQCFCRKPRPGMLLQAASEHGLCLPICWMIGDSESDIAAGVLAGCKTAWITCTHPFPLRLGVRHPKPDLTVPDLLTAAARILSRGQVGGQ